MSVVEDCSFFDFSHDITCTEKRYVWACVKTYGSTGTYITVKLFKKNNFRDQTQDNRNNCNNCGFMFNQKITLSLAEFEQLSQSYTSLCEKLRTGQSEQPIKKERNKITGKNDVVSLHSHRRRIALIHLKLLIDQGRKRTKVLRATHSIKNG